MNNQRRKQIREIEARIEKDFKPSFEKLRAMLLDFETELTDLNSDIEGIKDEEQDYLDNLPENLRGGDKASASEEAVNALEEVINSISEALEQFGNDIDLDLDDCITKLNEARGEM